MAGARGHKGMGASFLDPCYCQDSGHLGASVLGGGVEEQGSQRKGGADLCSFCHGLSAALSL